MLEKTIKTDHRRFKVIKAKLFTKYINEEYMPAIWKTAGITPIYEIGKKDLCQNCRWGDRRVKYERNLLEEVLEQDIYV